MDIKKRVSYQRFLKLANVIGDVPNRPKILRAVHGLIDDCRGFHYQKHADAAEESVEQLIKDLKNK